MKTRTWSQVRGAGRRQARWLGGIVALAALCATASPIRASAHIYPSGTPVATGSCPMTPVADETVDGVRYRDIPARPSVAWVLGLTRRPGWALAGDLFGLTLAALYYQPAQFVFRSAQTYQQYRSANNVREFGISTWLVDPSEASNACVRTFAAARAPVAGTQDVSLSIAGVWVPGRYSEIAGYRTLIGPHATHASGGLVQTFRAVDIDEGDLRIRLSARGLSRDEFMGVIGALVDGRTHPDIVTRLQHELDTAEPSTPH